MIRRPPRSPLFPYTPLSRPGRSFHPCNRPSHTALRFPGAIISISSPYLEGEQPLRAHHQDDDHDREREHLGHGSGHEKLGGGLDRKSTRLNSSHLVISYAVF